MRKLTENINSILSEWDPLNLGEDISQDEYRGYIPLIISNIENKSSLILCLERILVNNLEVGYDCENNEHKKNLEEIATKILQLK